MGLHGAFMNPRKAAGLFENQNSEMEITMKRFFLAFSAAAMTMLAVSTHAQAQDTAFDGAAIDELTFDAVDELGNFDLDATLEMARPGRPGHGPGWGPGPGYGPGWGPGPGHGPLPPPPPPSQSYETLNCSSNDYRYAECYFNPRGVQGVSLSRQLSRSQCVYGRTYGIYNDRVWVQDGCRAEFVIQRRFRR